MLLPSLLHGADQGLPWKAAVIGHTGHGDFGHGLERIFTGRKEVQLVALADPDPEGRAKAAAGLGSPRAYADYREMLSKERPQLVSLAMRHAQPHHTIGRDVLQSGAHLYCEKPFVTSPREADDLLAEAKARGLKIAVAHTMRLTPVVRALRAAVSEGILGTLVEIRAHGKQDSRAGGEDLMVLGTHLFDLMRLFAGDPLSCSARVLEGGQPVARKNARRVRDDVGLVAGDRVFASFEFAGGVHATFTSAADLRETAGHWGLELRGSKATARIFCDISPAVFIRRPGGVSEVERTDAWEKLASADPPNVADHNSAAVDDWLKAIVENREPECSGRNGAWAIEMVAAVYGSALTGRTVRFPLEQREHPLDSKPSGGGSG